ncbi:hypothetical protein LQ948_10850 [Jiella sp. MQZ9-1]|uniref:Uncharacterized protein n=1 Tax=Jiella flava TaxID=2816857 RepID=A0A939JWN0_9HYPH|nr:hypothetical protein [Jiella flava]MBO0662481.1 hypothetical protein [Jiella flava]MCD2471706.1 hypothetical protein [Jiella flava]
MALSDSSDMDLQMATLIHEIARCKTLADEFNLPFAVRLLDLCLLEVAMEWEGRSREEPLGDEELLIVLLRSKLKIALSEHPGGVIMSSTP